MISRFPQPARRSATEQVGFTLVEVLVAMAITGLVAVMAYGSLSAVSSAVEESQQQADSLDAMDRTWMWLARDFQHALPEIPAVDGLSDVRGPESKPLPLGLRGVSPRQTNMIWLQLARDGWHNPLQQVRSDQQVVLYQLKDGYLHRWSGRYDTLAANDWFLNEGLAVEDFAPERVDSSVSARRLRQQVLLEDVVGLEVRFLPASASSLSDDAWHTEWPPTARNRALPLAIEVVIDSTTLGRITRLFVLGSSRS